MLPQWSTPERQSRMVEMFQRSNGLCVYGHPQCPVEAHCYEEYLEGIISEWKSADASRRAFEWEMESRHLHGIGDGESKHRITDSKAGKRRKTIKAFAERGWNGQYTMVRGELRHHDPITEEQRRENLPIYEIVGYGVDVVTFHKAALVRIPGLALPVHLWVDVGKAMQPSRNARRKAERYGVPLPIVGELCKAAVLDWRQKHNLD